MSTYIALFRGINVGGKNILPMNDLKEIFEDMGCEKTTTYIQSGNVVCDFNSGQKFILAEEIGRKILEKFGFTPVILILQKSELLEAIHNNPLQTDDGKLLHFFFLESVPQNSDMEKFMALKTPTEDFKLIGKVFYLYAPDGIGRSKLASNIQRSLGVKGYRQKLEHRENALANGHR